MSLDDISTDPAWTTIRRGFQLSPELRDGWVVTMLLALVGTAGRVIVPISVQQGIDHGVNATGGVNVRFVSTVAVVAGVAVVLTAWSSYAMTVRLFRSSERGLATLRIRAFRHVHDLPLLTQNTERRGALVSRVTSDVDQVSQFIVYSGITGIISVGQIAVATVVMLFYSWQLTLVVWVCFLPLFASLRYFQQRLSAAYGIVRASVGQMLSLISEPVVGALVVRPPPARRSARASGRPTPGRSRRRRTGAVGNSTGTRTAGGSRPTRPASAASCRTASRRWRRRSGRR